MYVPKTISLFEVYIGTQNKGGGASVWQNITQTEVRLFFPQCSRHTSKKTSAVTQLTQLMCARILLACFTLASVTRYFQDWCRNLLADSTVSRKQNQWTIMVKTRIFIAKL